MPGIMESSDSEDEMGPDESVRFNYVKRGQLDFTRSKDTLEVV